MWWWAGGSHCGSPWWVSLMEGFFREGRKVELRFEGKDVIPVRDADS